MALPGQGVPAAGLGVAGDGPIRFALPELPPGQYRLRLVLFSQHRLALRPRYTLEEEVGR